MNVLQMLTFTANENAENHVVINGEDAGSSVKVSVSTLDSIIADQSPQMMKIDVEGYETCVLKGAHDTLSSPSLHSIIMEMNGSGIRYGFKDEDILALLKSYGFCTYHYEPASRELISLNGKSSKSGGNTLFIRNEANVKERLDISART